MSTRSLLLLVVIIFSANIARSQNWYSATAILSPQAVYNKGVATADNGNVYVVGSFFNAAIFGSTILMSQGLNDGFVAKYNTNGSIIWVKHLSGLGGEEINAINILPNGDCIIAGYFENTANFAGIPLNSINRNTFVAKLSSNGAVSWIRNATAPFGGGEATSIATDNVGNIYMAGHFTLQLDFGTIALTSSGTIDMFVAKYDSTGLLQWAKKGGGSDNSSSFYNGDKAYAVGVNYTGTSVFVTGVFNDTATFGTHTLITDVNYRGEDVFLVKYDGNTGNELWARQGGGIGSADIRAGAYSLDEGRAIAVDPSGNCYLAGIFDTVAVFSGTTLTSNGISDIFLAKYSGTGTLEWIRQAGGKSIESLGGIALDFGNNVYITGGFSDTASFGTTTLSTSLFSEVFVAKYSNTGDAEWVATAGGKSNDVGTAIYVDNIFVPNVYVAGTFTDTATFGNDTLKRTGSSNLPQGFVSILNTSPSSIKEKIKSHGSIIIYPNPVEDRLFIKTEQSHQANRVIVYDVAGRKLYAEDFNKNEFSIDTAAFTCRHPDGGGERRAS